MAVQQNKKSRRSAACTGRTITWASRRSRSSPPRARRTCATTSRRRATTAARRSSRRRTRRARSRAFIAPAAMKTVIAVDAMGGDHGPSVTVPACIDFLAAHPDAELLLVGLKEPLEKELARLHASGEPRITIVPAAESRRHGRGRAHRHPHQEAFVHARRDRPREGGPRAGLRERGQHRRAHGHREIRAEDAARHRPPRDLRGAADAHRAGLRARPRRQRRLHARAPAAVRDHGLDAREGG